MFKRTEVRTFVTLVWICVSAVEAVVLTLSILVLIIEKVSLENEGTYVLVCYKSLVRTQFLIYLVLNVSFSSNGYK